MPVQIDMEMPTGCDVCSFKDLNYSVGVGWCNANVKNNSTHWDIEDIPSKRPEWCPLMEVEGPTWHVVADGDLPEEIGNYLVTVERTFFGGKYPRGRVVREVLQAYFKRDDSYIVGYVWWSDCADLDDRDVLAWRKLPEPWEGITK